MKEGSIPLENLVTPGNKRKMLLEGGGYELTCLFRQFDVHQALGSALRT